MKLIVNNKKAIKWMFILGLIIILVVVIMGNYNK